MSPPLPFLEINMGTMPHINWLAVLAAAVAAFMLGGLWFSPVMFAKQWVAALGKKPEEMGMPGPSMALSFVMTLIMSTALALVIGKMPEMTTAGSIRFGLAVGAGIVATGMASDYAFTNWPRKLYFIQASYHVVMVVLISVILSAWR
jgi:hypothetical protein